ncbi:Metapyrocatechase [Zalerion maritima]|uniref:Metapyrocatechase n=1 Tax=Zalerion maritima TaxID=339359 RepID=A0AAD5WR75_9PEZI|nr:Metapyrocatechase [Zalerion maritima]
MATFTAPATSSSRKIQIVRLAHVYYAHKNLASASKFLEDFGFVESKRCPDRIFYRGYGADPFVYCAVSGSSDSFGGVAAEVGTLEDLELASATIPGATSIYDLGTEKGAPGAGKGVTFHDPVDGWPMHLVWGQEKRRCEEAAEDEAGEKKKKKKKEEEEEEEQAFRYLEFNFFGASATSELTMFSNKGPALIHKLGHFGMCVTDFKKAYEFYTGRFNFVASDLLHNPAGQYEASFMHIDLGVNFTDHHSFFIFQGPVSHVHHTSYEVHDFDTEVLGHDWLRNRGYKNCWGVGRHVMGSQIFDYWYDPSDFIVEHYVDGDLVNEDTETKISESSPDGLHVWGPDLPDGFLA